MGEGYSSSHFSVRRDRIKSCNAQRDTNSFTGYGQQQKQPGQGYPEAIPSQSLEMVVLSLNGGLASFSGFVAVPQPFGDNSQMLSLGLVPRAGKLATRGLAPPDTCGPPASALTEALIVTACPSTVAPRTGSACRNQPMACHCANCALLIKWMASREAAIEMNQ